MNTPQKRRPIRETADFGHFYVITAVLWLKFPQKFKKKEINAFLFDKTIVLL